MREPQWSRAACSGLGPQWFHPERGQSTVTAKEVCARCPIQPECLDYAVATLQKFGIWGGKSERERRQLRRRQVA